MWWTFTSPAFWSVVSSRSSATAQLFGRPKPVTALTNVPLAAL
jgi:hypothetical protein